jgi:hypothetical protein
VDDTDKLVLVSEIGEKGNGGVHAGKSSDGRHE